MSGGMTEEELDDFNQRQNAPEPKTIDIPENVTLEIRRLHLTLVADAKKFQASKIAFGEFMRNAMKILNVPTDGSWDVNDEATQFKERPNATN